MSFAHFFLQDVSFAIGQAPMCNGNEQSAFSPKSSCLSLCGNKRPFSLNDRTNLNSSLTSIWSIAISMMTTFFFLFACVDENLVYFDLGLKRRVSDMFLMYVCQRVVQNTWMRMDIR